MSSGVGPRVGATLVCGVLLAGCAAGADSTAATAPAPGANPVITLGLTTYPAGQRPDMPDLDGPTLSGGSLRLSALTGQVVVVNAWASWCEPCRTEAPELADLAKATRALGVQFVGIDEQDSQDSARSFASKAGMSYPHLVDESGTMLASLRRLVPPSAVPSTLVLDRDGKVAGRVIGPVDPAALAALVRTLAEEPAPAASP